MFEKVCGKSLTHACNTITLFAVLQQNAPKVFRKQFSTHLLRCFHVLFLSHPSHDQTQHQVLRVKLMPSSKLRVSLKVLLPFLRDWKAGLRVRRAPYPQYALAHYHWPHEHRNHQDIWPYFLCRMPTNFTAFYCLERFPVVPFLMWAARPPLIRFVKYWRRHVVYTLGGSLLGQFHLTPKVLQVINFDSLSFLAASTFAFAASTSAVFEGPLVKNTSAPSGTQSWTIASDKSSVPSFKVKWSPP